MHIIDEVPKPPEQPIEVVDFKYQKGRDLMASRAMLNFGIRTPLPLDTSGMAANMGTYDQSTPHDIQARNTPYLDKAMREENLNRVIADLKVHNPYLAEVRIDEPAYVTVDSKLYSFMGEDQGRERRIALAFDFFVQFGKDIGSSSYDVSWQSATEDSPWLSNFHNGYVDSDSTSGKVLFAYAKDYESMGEKAVANSRSRCETFDREHGATIEKAVLDFPKIALQFFKDNDLDIDPEFFNMRYNQIKNNVYAVSYLEEVMTEGALGVYRGDLDGIFLNADSLAGESKQSIVQVIFHELLHGVATENNITCNDPDEIFTFGPGVPHSRWIREGVTEYAAREMTSLYFEENAAKKGAYDEEVQVLSNIMGANEKIKKLLIQGNFEGVSVDVPIADLKTHQALSAIESVYGVGFVAHVEKILNPSLDMPIDVVRKETDRILQYTKKPELLKKVSKAVLALSLVAGTSVATINIADSFLDKTQEIAALEQEVADLQPEMQWTNLSPEEAIALVNLNTTQSTGIVMGAVEQGMVQVRRDGITKYYKNPIYFTQGEKIYVLISNNGPEAVELGATSDKESALLSTTREDGAITLVPVVPFSSYENGQFVLEDESRNIIVSGDITDKVEFEYQRRLAEALSKFSDLEEN